jgi:hypothetical protein
MTAVRRFEIGLFLLALAALAFVVLTGAPVAHECGLVLLVLTLAIYGAWCVVLSPLFAAFVWLCAFLPFRLTRRTVQIVLGGELLLLLPYVIHVALQPTPQGCRFH